MYRHKRTASTPAWMPLPSSKSHTLEDSSSFHSFIPPDLTGQITKFDNQYCAAGGFGDVYRCQYHSGCGVKEVAVKTFRFEFTVEEEDINGRSNRMIRRELGIWKRLSHPNIVPFLGTVSGFGRFGNASLVSAWMPNGTLQDFLLKYDGKLTATHRLQFMLGIANGLQYLHSLSVVHGDLTCTNVLLDEKHNARLTDFGYASLVGEIPEALVYLQASTLRPGAVRWAAPEYFFSNPEEMIHCTTKSDIYSFGNIALQVLSGELPWAEFRRDVVIVLHLAKGHKPRRPQSRPIDDHYWDFIERCWSPVQERPSVEHLVSSIQDFLRSCPHPQPFCSLLASSEKSNTQSLLSEPLLSPPKISHDILRATENLHSVAPNRQHDQSPTVGGLSPPGTTRCSPQLIPDNDSSAFPLLSKEPRTYGSSEDDHGDETTSRAGCFQSTLEKHNQNGPAVNPDTSVTETVFPKRPPPAHSKSGVASPPFLDTTFIGQDQLSIYPFLYPTSLQHSTHHHRSQGITANRGGTSGSRGKSGGIWSFLSSHFSQDVQKTSPVGATLSQQSVQFSQLADRSQPSGNAPLALPQILPSSESYDGGDAAWSVSSFRHPRRYSRPSPRICHEDLPNPPPFAPQFSAPCPGPPQPNDGGLSTVPRKSVTNECTAGAGRRRKYAANFLCPVPGCGSTFAAGFSLRAHMKSHNMERPFRCEWPGCGMHFIRQHDWRRHERLHSKYRPSTCEGCNKTFVHKDALNRHRDTECQRILDAPKDSEGPLVPKSEEKGWPSISIMV